MTQSQVPPMPAGARPPGPGLGASLAVAGIGAVVVFVAVVAIVIPLVGTFTSPVYPVPGEIDLHLKHAHYTVYRYSGSRSAFGSVTTDPNAERLPEYRYTV